MRDNPCGTCTQCCKTMGVTELAKPRDRWCTHCAVGHSCRIYDDRPQSCRDFVCLWLHTQGQEEGRMPEALRPDRCKVVFDMKAMPNGAVALAAYVDIGRPRAAQEGAAAAFIRQALERDPDLSVAYIVGDSRSYEGTAQFLDAIGETGQG